MRAAQQRQGVAMVVVPGEVILAEALHVMGDVEGHNEQARPTDLIGGAEVNGEDAGALDGRYVYQRGEEIGRTRT